MCLAVTTAGQVEEELLLERDEAEVRFTDLITQAVATNMTDPDMREGMA